MKKQLELGEHIKKGKPAHSYYDPMKPCLSTPLIFRHQRSLPLFHSRNSVISGELIIQTKVLVRSELQINH